MVILYNLFIFLFRVIVTVGSAFNPKARALKRGQREVFNLLTTTLYDAGAPVIWMHCASLGEFEQGRPVIEALKKNWPHYKVVLTFFSPSGYEVRKNSKHADYIFYLPWDTQANARKFISTVRPALAIFIKYEFWYHYANELKKQNIPLLSVSAIFRKDQFFFRSYGTFLRNVLKKFSHFFVQNEESLDLLRSIHLENCTIAGDTRFDRVYQIVKDGSSIPVAEAFKANQKVLVAGSCWQEDLDVLVPFINENRLKFIIAPHELSESLLTSLEKSLTVKSIRFSHSQGISLEEYTVLIIDNIGMLSRLYRYGEFAYIGGAYGKGLHNILEAACYGIPIFFGNKSFENFQEAVDLINRGGAFEVADYPDLKAKYEMVNVPESFMLACEVTRQYVEENLGATDKILQYCKKIIH